MIVDWDASSEIKTLLHPKLDNSFLLELNGILIFDLGAPGSQLL